MHGAKATCKRTQQLPILFARQYWELLWQCWRVVCKQLQTLLGPAVHRGKDTTHKTLETMCNARAWLQQCWKSCANGSNIVALRFGDHRTKEILGVVGSKFWTVSNFAEQHATTCNNKQHGVQTDATCNIQQCCICLREAWYMKNLHAFFLVSMTCFRLAKHEEPVRRLFFDTLLKQFWHDNSYVINQL